MDNISETLFIVGLLDKYPLTFQKVRGMMDNAETDDGIVALSIIVGHPIVHQSGGKEADKAYLESVFKEAEEKLKQAT